MKKIVVLDKIVDGIEPYDRQYVLGEVAGYCRRNPSILRNAGIVIVMSRGYHSRIGVWDDTARPVYCVCFEIDELTEAKREFLLEGIGSWAVELKVLPDYWETTILYPSEFKK
ncbi:MAG: hypothetical protein Q7K26_02775 [bacterium]|nr:hypothetical protein [bacterium]